MDSIASSGVSAKAEKTAQRYLGDMSAYEAKRAGKAKWDGEDRVVRAWLGELPKGSLVLDIPCGTGRFFPFYAERGFRALGLDISPDMVFEAGKRIVDRVSASYGSIFAIDAASNRFDAALCCRFLNLIEAEDVKKALAELQRVSKSRVIFTLRIKQKNPTGHYHSAYPISLVEESLLPGWRIERNEPVHEEDYRMIQLGKS